MTAAYVEENGHCGMLLYPSEMEKEVSVQGEWKTDSLVQVKIVGDAYPAGFANGHSMRNSQTAEALRLVSFRG